MECRVCVWLQSPCLQALPAAPCVREQPQDRCSELQGTSDQCHYCRRWLHLQEPVLDSAQVAAGQRVSDLQVCC